MPKSKTQFSLGVCCSRRGVVVFSYGVLSHFQLRASSLALKICEALGKKILLCGKVLLGPECQVAHATTIGYRVLDVLLDLSEGVVQESPSNSLCVRKIEQRGGLFTDEFAQRQPLDPCLRDRVDAVKSAGELTVDRSSCVSIIAQVHGAQCSFSEGVGAVKRPECRLKRAHDEPAADDLGRFPLFK
jgi:hypothetical protein